MKKVSAFLISAVMMCSGIRCLAADIWLDGVVNDYEWKDCGYYQAEDTKLSCNIDFGNIKYIFEPDTYTLFLAATFTEEGATGDGRKGIYFSVNGEEEIFVGENENINNDYCALESVSENYASGFYASEMRITLKKRNYSRVDLMFAFSDSYGSRSGNYYVNIFDGITRTEETTQSAAKPPKETTKKSRSTTKKSAKTTVSSDKVRKETKENSRDGYVTVILSSEAMTSAKKMEKEAEATENEGAKKIVKTASYICIGGIIAAYVLSVLKKRKK